MPNDLISELLIKRGVISPLDQERFLRPDFELHTHDPFLLPNMETAVARLADAINGNEKIVIYSDYDADGIPGGVIFYDFFNRISFTNFYNYIPHRHDEGFGLNKEAIEQFSKDGATLVITIDCGITDCEEVAYARDLGIDVIITDHHEPHEQLPEACAVVDPKLKDSQYPFKELCGAAVGYKLIDALIKSKRVPQIADHLKPGHERWLLDMVGIATLSDMVPLIGENRVFALYGLKVLRKTNRAGMQKLFSRLKLKQKQLTEDDIVFMISPRINAASRMAHPMDAFKALANTDVLESHASVEFLLKVNDERKALGSKLSKEVAKREYEYQHDPVIVIGNPEWKPGILGLMANNLAEKMKKSVFLWGREDAPYYKGSVRSYGNEHVVEIMKYASLVHPDIFLDYGGHAASGGFSVSQEKIHSLSDAIQQGYERYCAQSSAALRTHTNTQEADYSIRVKDVTDDFVTALETLAPFGMANPKPLFELKGVFVADMKRFGKNKEHVEVHVTDGESSSLSCIAFFARDDMFFELDKGDRLSITGNIEKSFFGYTPKIRMRIHSVARM